jgi:Ca2+/Na+ antiporter
MEKSKINFNWLFIIIFVLIQFILKRDVQFYANIALICIMLPFFIHRLIKTYKENSEEKNNFQINLILLIVFLIVGYLIISEKFKV